MTGRETLKSMIKKAVAANINSKIGYESVKWMHDYEYDCAKTIVKGAINRMIDSGMLEETDYTYCEDLIDDVADDYIAKEHILVVADDTYDDFIAVNNVVRQATANQEAIKSESDCLKAKQLATDARRDIYSMDISNVWCASVVWYINREIGIINDKLDFIKNWR